MNKAIVIASIVLCWFSPKAQPIVGGTNASQTEFPYIAGLVDKGTANLYDGIFCGATHIAPDWILTAAHCLYDDLGNKLTKHDLDVFLNVWKLKAPGAAHERISVKNIHIHPNFDDNTFDNDIALIQLSRSSALPIVKLVSYNQSGLYQVPREAQIAGWGIYDVKNNLAADVLRRATIDIISSTACNAPASYNGEVTTNMFCAGKSDGSKDACQGDSGGPLVVYDNADTLQIGIVSWGDGCAIPNFPGVYTKVINYLPWINTVTNGGVSVKSLSPQLQVSWNCTASALSLYHTQQTSANYALYSLHGVEIATGFFNHDIAIPISHLASEVYILRVWDGYQSYHTKIKKP